MMSGEPFLWTCVWTRGVALVHPGCDCSMNADMIYGLICLHAHVCIAVVIETLLLPCVTDNLPRRMSEYVQCLIVFPLHSLHPVW